MTVNKVKFSPILGIFGGAFDPVHIGHLNCAWEIMQKIPLDTLHFIPSAEPAYVAPEKSPARANKEARLEMLKLAIEHETQWVVDDRELRRGGKSYTIDTLRSLHTEFPQHHLCLILGEDTACTLPTWKKWQELLTLAHIIMITRPNYVLPREEWVKELRSKEIKDPALLKTIPAGCFFQQQVTQLCISSTIIRELSSKKQPPKFLLTEKVLHYIQKHQLYQE